VAAATWWTSACPDCYSRSTSGKEQL